jgi:hypothetical protein
MPIIDIELVCESELEFAKVSARNLADVLGHALSSEPGRTWVRVRFLTSSDYAENQVSVSNDELPTFVTVLHAHPPTGEGLIAEASLITEAVAQCLARLPERLHVQYAAAGAGRQAFGGHLVQ